MKKLKVYFRQKITPFRYHARLQHAMLMHTCVQLTERVAHDTPDDSPFYAALVHVAVKAMSLLQHDLDYLTGQRTADPEITHKENVLCYQGVPVVDVLRVASGRGQ